MKYDESQIFLSVALRMCFFFASFFHVKFRKNSRKLGLEALDLDHPGSWIDLQLNILEPSFASSEFFFQDIKGRIPASDVLDEWAHNSTTPIIAIPI